MPHYTNLHFTELQETCLYYGKMSRAWVRLSVVTAQMQTVQFSTGQILSMLLRLIASLGVSSVQCWTNLRSSAISVCSQLVILWTNLRSSAISVCSQLVISWHRHRKFGHQAFSAAGPM